MRKALFTAFLASALVLPLAAHADTIADFTLVGQGHTITYSLPDTAILVDHPHGITLNASALTTVDGVPGYNESGVYYLSPGQPGLPSMVLDVPPFIDRGFLVFYGGGPLQLSEVIPMGFGQPDDLLVAFVPGTYNEALNYLPLGNPPIAFYTLTVTIESAATPEPSTLALFTTGLLGLGSLVRRRFRV